MSLTRARWSTVQKVIEPRSLGNFEWSPGIGVPDTNNALAGIYAMGMWGDSDDNFHFFGGYSSSKYMR